MALYTPLKCFVLHATSPLGCAVVRRFAVEGPMFMLTDLPHAKDALEGLARAAAKQGASRCHMHVGDIYQWAGEQEITRTALSTMGEVDVLVVVPPEEGRQGATARTAPRHTAVVRGLVEAFLPRMEKDRRGWVLAVLRPGRDDRLANELQALRTVRDWTGRLREWSWVSIVKLCSVSTGQTSRGQSYGLFVFARRRTSSGGAAACRW